MRKSTFVTSGTFVVEVVLADFNFHLSLLLLLLWLEGGGCEWRGGKRVEGKIITPQIAP